jgi:two-component system OmpR family response regulator
MTPPNGNATLRVLVIDDAPQVRERLVQLITGFGWAQVAGTAEDGASGLAAIRVIKPDAVVLDIRMPWTDGFGVLQALRTFDPAPEVVVLTNYAISKYRERCLELGARAVLDKTLEFEQLESVLAAIRSERSGAGGASASKNGAD